MRKALSIILALLICFTTCFGGAVSVAAENSTYTIDQMEGKYKTQGRTEVKDGMLLIDYSASGIEFKANCSGSVSIDVAATRITDSADCGGVYFTVIVDGQTQYADLRIPEDSNADNWKSNSTNYPFYMSQVGDYTFEIATDLPLGEHTFEIYNQSQASKGAFGIKSVTLNGTLADAPADNELLIEVVGDSIAAGHGNIANGGASAEYSLYTDATRGWPYLTAKALNADWSVIAQSGIAATPGVCWAGAGSSSPSMDDVYPYLRYYSDSATEYSFDRPADIILVCLGTNDVWLYQDESRGYSLTNDDLKAAFKDTLSMIRGKNENAKIVWLYGMLTSAANDMITSAVSEMGGAENGYYTLELAYNAEGGSYHPGLAVQTAYADDIVDFINKKLLSDGEIWDGKTTTAPEGKGTSVLPYLISNAEELAYIIKSGGAADTYYKLTNDIYLNDINGINWETGEAIGDYVPNSWYENIAFQGNINGNGHVVYGLYYEDPTGNANSWGTYGVGLVPRVAYGTSVSISNLGIENAYVHFRHGASAFVGHGGTDNSATDSRAQIKIDCCYAGEKVYISGNDAGVFRGSSRGVDTRISNCYSLATVNGTMFYGLVAGEGWESADYIENTFNANGTLASNAPASVTNCYQTVAGYNTDGVITAENMQGLDVFTNLEKMPNLNGTRKFLETEKYPMLKCFDKSLNFEYPWDGSEEAPRALDDNGSIIITKPSELAYVIKNGGGANYVLGNDIYLNDLTSVDWSTGDAVFGYAPVEWYTTSNSKYFSGTIDGQGHTVYGLYYGSGIPADAGSANYKREAVALIPGMKDDGVTTVKNLGIDFAYIKGSQCAAALAGNSNGIAQKSFENCYVGENVTVTGHVAGGIFGGGDAELSVKNCYSLATLNATYSAGGIYGNVWSYAYDLNGVSTDTKRILSNSYTTYSSLCGGSAQITDSYAGIGENCKGQAAIKNFPLYEPFCATVDSYPTLRVFTDIGEGNWNGLGISTFKGEGTDESPYLVENAGQLAYVAYSGVSGHYKMTGNIYINDVTVENWQNNNNLINWIWEEDHEIYSYQNENKRFKGTFDGNGYTVQGIWYSKDIVTQSAALFLSIGNDAVVKNVGVKNSYMYAGYTQDYVSAQGWDKEYNAQTMAVGIVGGIVGWADRYSNSFVSGCFTDETVHLTNYSNGNVSSVGGIVGFIMNNYDQVVTISDCWSAAQMTSAVPSSRQGILGATWNGHFILKDCYSLSFEPTRIGDGYNSLLENAYVNVYSNAGTTCDEYTVLENAQLMGENAVQNLGFSEDIWYSVRSEQGTPLHRLYGTSIGDVDEDGTGKTVSDMTALRQTLVNAQTNKNTDYNRNGESNICDLVKMALDYKPIITFNANGGTFGGTKTVLVAEQTVGNAFAVEIPTYEKFTCVGWSLTPDGEALDNTVTAELDGATLYSVWKEMLVISPVFKKNMVLQRNKPICVYGTGYGTGEITIGDQTKTVTSTDGEWEVYFEPMEASTSAVTFKTNFSGIETSYNNVLIGDVYLASGQSNMAFALSNTEQTGTVPDNSLLRFSYTATGGWYEFTQAVVEDSTAIGVMFATEIAKATNNNIPIGIISVSRGASRIDCWTHSDYCYCDEYDFVNTAHSDYHGFDFGHHGLYESMIMPLEKMTTAGVLWYQGESNAGIGEAYRYLDMFRTFVDCWRTRMDDPTLPFYTVQIMLYSSDTAVDVNGNLRDEYNIRIAQGEAARTMDNVTVCTMLSREDTMRESDGWLDIHPTDKYPIAKALANAALSTYYYPQGDYNETPEYSGPLYDSVTVDGNTATVTFNHTAEGLMLTKGSTVTELEVRDENGNWTAATGVLQGNPVVVTADVGTVTGVRMGYRNLPEINLYNTINGAYGYCASPFIWVS